MATIAAHVLESTEPYIIDVGRTYYRELNNQIRELAAEGVKRFVLKNVMGQRYLCAGLSHEISVEVHGTPGEDMAVFMDGPKITVYGNAQNAIGNTMNEGKIVVHGLGGDVIGYGMRGGRIYVRDNVGYRVGIHMKGYFDKQPVIVVGGKAGDFLGEYMAGGCLVVLGATVNDDRPIVGDYCAAGMHGGRLYVRGQVRAERLGKEVKVFNLEEQDVQFLTPILQDFAHTFNRDLDIFDFGQYCKILPVSSRPYGNLYAY